MRRSVASKDLIESQVAAPTANMDHIKVGLAAMTPAGEIFAASSAEIAKAQAGHGNRRANLRTDKAHIELEQAAIDLRRQTLKRDLVVGGPGHAG